MMSYKSTILFLFLSAGINLFASNLIQNPGFEDKTWFLAKWTVANAKGGDKTYHYMLSREGGGHGNPGVNSGDKAIEIYTSGDRITTLAQAIEIKQSGNYRLSFYARPQKATFTSQLIVKLGGQEKNVYIVTQAWREYFVDFNISNPGTYELMFKSQNSGLGIDDIALQAMPKNAISGQIFCDLYPSSEQRAQNIQYYYPGVKQWVNYAISSPQLPKTDVAPELIFIFPREIKVEGFNMPVMQRYRPSKVKEMKLIVMHDNESVRYSMPLPSFSPGNGEASYSGFWISSEKPVKFLIKVLIKSGEKILTEATWQALPLEIPQEQSRPKRIKSICYHVTNWKIDLDAGLDAIPRLFSIAGFNVWSDYGLRLDDGDGKITNAEKLAIKAYNEYGIKNIWPNFSTMNRVDCANHYPSPRAKDGVKWKYRVDAEGKEHPNEYSALYMANGGGDWLNTCIAAWKNAAKRGNKIGIEYNGIINDGLESLFISFDPLTINDFAEKYNIEKHGLNSKVIKEKYRVMWTKYNLDLYSKICAIWAAAMKSSVPGIYVVNTHQNFGPIGSNELSPEEQMIWVNRDFDATMPQWYCPQLFHGEYTSRGAIAKGFSTKLYGKKNNTCDVIPLLLGGTPYFLANEMLNKHRVFDLLSLNDRSKNIILPGFGLYYHTGSFYVDAKNVSELNYINALVAKSEDYYLDGVREDEFVKFERNTESIPMLYALNEEGQQVKLPAKILTVPRVHKLLHGNRIALITLVTYSQGGLGDIGDLRINIAKLSNSPFANASIIDWQTGKTISVNSDEAVIPVKTINGGNINFFEIVKNK